MATCPHCKCRFGTLEDARFPGEAVTEVSPHTARRHTRQMLQRSLLAAEVAEALYRACRNRIDVDLGALTTARQMRYREAAERAILDLLSEDHRS